MSFNPSDLIEKLSFLELSFLAQACQARMTQIQSEGVRRLAEEFEKLSLEQVGLPAKAVLASLEKKRGRPPLKSRPLEMPSSNNQQTAK